MEDVGPRQSRHHRASSADSSRRSHGGEVVRALCGGDLSAVSTKDPDDTVSRDSVNPHIAPPDSTPTTVMIRHIACRYTERDVMMILDAEGLAGTYDFIHMPSASHSKRGNRGYAFVNFESPDFAEKCKMIFSGQKFGGSDTHKLCEVTVAHVQGAANLRKRHTNENSELLPCGPGHICEGQQDTTLKGFSVSPRKGSRPGVGFRRVPRVNAQVLHQRD